MAISLGIYPIFRQTHIWEDEDGINEILRMVEPVVHHSVEPLVDPEFQELLDPEVPTRRLLENTIESTGY